MSAGGGDAAGARRAGGSGAAEIECGMCGRTFREDRGQPVCRACPLTDACRYARCPHCGHENPMSPGWIDRLGRWLGRWTSEGSGGGDGDPGRRPDPAPGDGR